MLSQLDRITAFAGLEAVTVGLLQLDVQVECPRSSEGRAATTLGSVHDRYGGRVLLVGGESLSLATARKILAGQDLTVRHVVDPAAGLETLDGVPADLLIVDDSDGMDTVGASA
jgi:hypothetical protein